jgi:hypothetical protein
MQPMQMFVQLEDATVIKAQTFPDSIPTLHRRIEWTDPSLIAMDELAIDINDQVAISLVEFLQHSKTADGADNSDFLVVAATMSTAETKYRRLAQAPL